LQFCPDRRQANPQEPPYSPLFFQNSNQRSSTGALTTQHLAVSDYRALLGWADEDVCPYVGRGGTAPSVAV